MQSVRLAGREIPVSLLRDHPDWFRGLFPRARAEDGYGICLCRSDDPPHLVNRKRNGRHHLAMWPSQGHLHVPACRWYRPERALSGRTLYTGAAVAANDSGIESRLADSLITKTTAHKKEKRIATSASGTSQESRQSFGLLGLIHFLWEQAQLTLWHPGDGLRSGRTCHDRLREQTRACSINGIDLDTALHIVPPFRAGVADVNALAWESFIGHLGRAKSGHCRGLVLGELRDITPTTKGIRVRLAHTRAPLFASRQLGDRVRGSYRHAFTCAAEERKSHRVALCLVHRSKRGSCCDRRHGGHADVRCLAAKGAGVRTLLAPP